MELLHGHNVITHHSNRVTQKAQIRCGMKQIGINVILPILLGLGTLPTLWVKEGYLFHRDKECELLHRGGESGVISKGNYVSPRYRVPLETEKRLTFICGYALN